MKLFIKFSGGVRHSAKKLISKKINLKKKLHEKSLKYFLNILHSAINVISKKLHEKS